MLSDVNLIRLILLPGLKQEAAISEWKCWLTEAQSNRNDSGLMLWGIELSTWCAN